MLTEKSNHNQTRDYLWRNEYLYLYQSDFRENHSTDMILSGAENGKYIWNDFNWFLEDFWLLWS